MTLTTVMKMVQNPPTQQNPNIKLQFQLLHKPLSVATRKKERFLPVVNATLVHVDNR